MDGSGQKKSVFFYQLSVVIDSLLGPPRLGVGVSFLSQKFQKQHKIRGEVEALEGHFDEDEGVTGRKRKQYPP